MDRREKSPTWQVVKGKQNKINLVIPQKHSCIGKQLEKCVLIQINLKTGIQTISKKKKI